MPHAPVAPMLATPGELPVGSGWAYEFKWDGVRAIAVIEGGNVRFYARSGTEITAAYPELAGLATVAGETDGTVLDGEIVSLDEAGRPSFGALADRIHIRDRRRAEQLAASRPVTYMIFDLLRFGGGDLTRKPYRERRAALDDLGLEAPQWHVPPSFTDGSATRAAAAENRLEGVVAKRASSLYRPGVRSPDWVKFKIDQTAEFVVGGWRPGARALGALLIGVPEAESAAAAAITSDGDSDGGSDSDATGDVSGSTAKLAYRGRVGGGISAAAERALLSALAPLATDTPPFTAALPRAEAKDATWVRPELVIEVKYGEQTADGRLRFPRFLRIRPDLTPGDL